MDELISVIVPMYNRQEYIGECLQSILQQTCQSFEVIVIDDGSTDQSLSVCRAIAQTDDRIRILCGEHKGVSAARNLGIEAANGDYLLFVDSDDVIHPRLMEVLAEGMKTAEMAGPVRMLLPVQNWDAVKDRMRNSTKPAEIELQDNAQALEGIFSGNSPVSVIGGVMISRALVGETRFLTDLRIGEDFYFLYENLIKGANVLWLRRKWYLVRLHNSNTSRDYTYRGFWSRFHRRELVWQSEEKAGRQKYADGQKVEAYAIYRKCIKKAGVCSPDGKKMRKTLKQYKRVILPALKGKTRLAFYLSLYLPFTDKLLNRTK